MANVIVWRLVISAGLGSLLCTLSHHSPILAFLIRKRKITETFLWSFVSLRYFSCAFFSFSGNRSIFTFPYLGIPRSDLSFPFFFSDYQSTKKWYTNRYVQKRGETKQVTLDSDDVIMTIDDVSTIRLFSFVSTVRKQKTKKYDFNVRKNNLTMTSL